MTIDSTIQQAAERFGVPSKAITRGGFNKSRSIVRARDWIIGQHPEMSTVAIGRALNLDHSTVSLARIRIGVRPPPLPRNLPPPKPFTPGPRRDYDYSTMEMDLSTYMEIRKQKAGVP